MVDLADILNAKILIVDDLDANVVLLRRMLGGAGYTSVASTTNPVEVCELHRKHRYDLILLDILMPDMDGFQVMECLGKIESDGYLPVIVITAYTEHKARALQAGAKDFINTPFEIAEVLARVHNMLEVRVLNNEVQRYNDVLEQRILEKTAELVHVHRNLFESELRYREVFENISDGLFLLDVTDDMHFEIVELNPAEERSLGYSTSELLGKKVEEFLPAEVARQVTLQYHRCIDSGKSINYEEELVLPSGRRSFNTTLIPIRDAIGQIHRIVGVSKDITERKHAEARIGYLNRVYVMLSSISALIVRVNKREDLFVEACRVAVVAGGFRMAMIVMMDRVTTQIVPVASEGKDEELLTAIKVLLSSDKDAPNTMFAQAIREKKAVVAGDIRSDPKPVLAKLYVASGVRSMVVLPLIVAEEAVGAIALYAAEFEFFQEEELHLLTELAGDIAFAIDHIGKQEKLDYLAYYDVLTGLANRSLFLERVGLFLRSANKNGHKLALFLIDLERFKSINDSLGRPAGDALLRQVADWLTQKTGDVNWLARIDADHFAIVLPEIKSDGNLIRLVESLMAVFLAHPFRLNDTVFRVSGKVGVALFPDDATDADTLFQNAEVALKRAKTNGERFLFYTRTMTATVAGKLTLENQLRQAFDNEEFVLHYQPKVNLVSGRVTSAEALIRWNDPRTGLVPPGVFIPILEETGLIYEVGRWAMRKVIEDYLRWRTAGLAAVRIAVNVSPMQLRNRGFIEEIKSKIDVDAHAAAGLELEITESLIMEDVKHNIASLQAIRAMGVSIAIDDFGTGFSSLSYLSKLPIDTLKIDRSFVLDMTAGPQGLALVATIINLAHSLKLKVVAEGVETEEQSRLLRLLDCDEMQGFLFSRPVPHDIFESRYLDPFPRVDTVVRR